MWSRKRRFVGVLVAVVLGVTFLSGTLVLSSSIERGFSMALGNAMRGIDAVVRSEVEVGGDGRAPFDAGIVDLVATAPSVRAAVAQIEGRAQIVAEDGTLIGGGGPPTVGTSWIADADLNPFDLQQGREPAAPGEVVIDRGSAKTGGLSIGDTTTVLTPEPIEVTVVGIAAFGEDDSIGGTTYVAFTLEEARALFSSGQPRATNLLVAADEGVSQEELANQVAAVLPAGLEVVSRDELVAEQEESINEEFLGFLEKALLTFAGIALLVAALSIFNTFSILTAQRAREAALLRAVGASRRQILLASSCEAVIVGVVGTAVGVVVGVGVAAGLTRVLETRGPGFPMGGVSVVAGDLVAAGIVGLLVTVAGAVVPAIRSSRVAPLAALRDMANEQRQASRLRAAAGAVLTVGGVAAVLTAATGDGSMQIVGLGALSVLVGSVVAGPVVARPVTRAIGWPLRWRGAVGELAVRNAGRNPRRSAAAATSLLVGVGVVTVFTVMAASMAASMEDAIDRGFGGDLVIEASSFSGPGLPEAFIADLRALPETKEAVGLGFGVVRVEGEPMSVGYADIAALASVTTVDLVSGSLEAVSGSGFTVSEELAAERGWKLGDGVEMTFPDGATESLTVGAIHDDRAIGGAVLLPAATWARHVAQPAYVIGLVDLADGVALRDGRTAVAELAQPLGRPAVRDRAEFIESQAGQVLAVLNVVYGLLAIAVVIALAGIANTLAVGA